MSFSRFCFLNKLASKAALVQVWCYVIRISQRPGAEALLPQVGSASLRALVAVLLPLPATHTGVNDGEGHRLLLDIPFPLTPKAKWGLLGEKGWCGVGHSHFQGTGSLQGQGLLLGG